jgi:hypothetical protein
LKCAGDPLFNKLLALKASPAHPINALHTKFSKSMSMN